MGRAKLRLNPAGADDDASLRVFCGDFMPLLRLPGLIDPHVHLREPGLTHKEDLFTGTCAALAGGFTTVLDMPNTIPPTSTAERLAAKTRLAAAQAVCDVGFFVGATNDTDPSLVAAAGAGACGLKIYVSETFGSLRIDDLATLAAYFAAWQGPGPIAVHAEDVMLAACLTLAEVYNQRLHVVHVSLKSEIELIRQAKTRGQHVTCEATPHHLYLTQADLQRLGPYGDMRPALATESDRQALWDNLDIVDCIATDHAPHTRPEKESDNPPPGVPGLETALPLMLLAVHEGRLTMDDLIAKMHDNPRRIYNLPPQPDTFIEVDAEARYDFPASGWQTRAGWSPFAGMPAHGRVQRVVLRGREVYDEGRVLAAPGSGQVIGELATV
ncbi:MAG: amidohydrolase family protein [Caldilineales bacterium]|nr:amidohydrolase family protein [Caldilineales bacterium]